MHRCLIQYSLTMLSGVLAPACVPLLASVRLRQGLVDAGTLGDARQLAQVEVAQVRVELFPSSHLVNDALLPALQAWRSLPLALSTPGWCSWCRAPAGEAGCCAG